MIGHELKAIDGAKAGAWIRPRLGGTFGAVTLQVPKGFEAYARVFHPAFDRRRDPVTWAEVAKACGTTPHREMQWHAILGLHDVDELRGSYGANDGSGAKWLGSDPPTGAMDIETLDALCEILASPADSTHCFFGLCTINSWLESFSAERLPPLLELLYDRNYIVLAGAISAVKQIVYDWTGSTSIEMTSDARQGNQLRPTPESSECLRRAAPNLIWPANKSWFVASEVDFDSTLVGGSAMLIRAIVGSSKLEAWQVDPADSLADDADEVNRATKA